MERLDSSHVSMNPWEQDSRMVTTARNALILAEQMGFNTLDDSSQTVAAISDLSSTTILALQREITAKNKALFEVKKGIADHSQEREASDFIHMNVIEDRINMIKQLCSDLDAILKNKEILIDRLQKPYVGDHIKMDAAYHRYATELLITLVPTLNDLSASLDNIVWVANHDHSAVPLEPLLVEVQSLTASVQTSYQTLNQMTQGIKSLETKLTGSDASSVNESEVVGTPRVSISQGHRSVGRSESVKNVSSESRQKSKSSSLR